MRADGQTPRLESVMEGETAENPTLFPATAGEKLRAAREAQGLELSEVAARTRIPQRHLDAIEKANYAALPSVTYAIGFAKSYARAVGVDEVEIAREVRAELGRHPERATPVPAYEMEDPNHAPPRGLALAMVALVVVALIGFGLWYGTGLFRGTAPPPETLLIPENASGPAAATPAAPVAGGQVTLVALDTVWLRISDAKGQRLFEKEMTKGERYDVPADADNPHIRTPRPDRLQVLINGSAVAPLSAKAELVDMQVGAAALMARGQPAAAATPQPRPSASPVPAPSASPTAAAAPAASLSPTRPAPRPTATSAPAETATGNNSIAL